MKEATPEAITSIVEAIKQDAVQILQTGRVFSYGLLHRITEDAKPLDRLIEEFERRHMVVTEVPPRLPVAESRPSSSAATQPLAGATVERSAASTAAAVARPLKSGTMSSGPNRSASLWRRRAFTRNIPCSILC